MGLAGARLFLCGGFLYPPRTFVIPFKKPYNKKESAYIFMLQ